MRGGNIPKAVSSYSPALSSNHVDRTCSCPSSSPNKGKRFSVLLLITLLECMLFKRINSSLPHFYGLLAVFFVRGTLVAVGLETGSRGSQFSRFGDNTWAIFQLRLRRARLSFHHRPFARPSTVDASRENPNVSRSRIVGTTGRISNNQTAIKMSG